MNLIVRELGRQAYETTWHAMQAFTQQRDATTPDELWLLEHDPVFTLGQAGKEEHILNRSHIPVLKVDRGGQVTYHGPGQLMAYVLIDLKRKKLSVHQLVHSLENTLIKLLATFNITAHANPKAPGVYVGDKKIASVGLRIRKGCSYHGLAFNVDMDLSPFNDINPCGYEHLKMTQLSEYVTIKSSISSLFIEQFCQELGYNYAI